jgi:cation transport ATPase
MHLLLEFCHPHGEAAAERLARLLCELPGVSSVKLNAAVGQADVVLAASSPTSPEDMLTRVRDAGYFARVSQVPDANEDSEYARYYHSRPDSSESLWIN